MLSVTLPKVSRTAERPVWLDGENRDFQNSSINRSDYVRHNLKMMPKLPDIRSSIGAYTSTLPLMDHISEHRDKYRMQPILNKKRRIKRGLLAIPQVPFERTSNYGADFVPLNMVPTATKNFKPADLTHLSTEPFNATSVYRSDFPYCKQQNESLDSQEVCATIAAGKQTYIPARNNKERALDGQTEYVGNFLIPDTKARMFYPPGYSPPTERFATETSYQSCYVPFPIAPAKSMRRDDKTLLSEEPFNGITLYKDTYVAKPLRKSSANILQNRTGVMNICRNDSPTDPGVETEAFLENYKSVLYTTGRK